MIIFTGWGAAVVIGIAFLALMAGALVTNVLGLDRDAMPIIAMLLLVPGGVLTWYVGKRINRHAERELIDPGTGERVLLRNYHSLFFLRVEWWGPIMVVGGILLALLMLLRSPGSST